MICPACDRHEATDARTIRIGHQSFELDVCASCARRAPTVLYSLVEDAIHEGRVVVPEDSVYGP